MLRRIVALCVVLHPLVALLAVPAANAAEKEKEKRPAPEWIWSRKEAKPDEQVFFRKTFEVSGDIKTARAVVSCDNYFTLFVNGEKVLEHGVWAEPAATEVSKLLKQGKNTI